MEKAEGDLGAGGDVWPVDESLLNSLKEQYKRDRVNAKRGAAIGAHLKAAAAIAAPDSASSTTAFDAPIGSNEGSRITRLDQLLQRSNPASANTGCLQQINIFIAVNILGLLMRSKF